MCFGSKTPEEKIDSEITKSIKKDEAEFNSRIKLLLLGAGESGKSTFFKQMKIIHLNGFTKEEEREEYKKIVFSNILGNIISLLEASQKLDIPIAPENKEAAQKVFSMDAAQDFGENGLGDLSADLKSLWNDPAIQKCFSRSFEFQLNDSTEYFFNNLDRISSNNYLPTVDDILRIRVKTSGITEAFFEVKNEKFVIVDVGGQRSERRKWIHCFTDVTAIIFFAALSEYDQKLSEEVTINRMSEALKLFKDISNYKCFIENETAIILFLNKFDLFKKKIERVPLTVFFPNYQGSNDPEEGFKYIKEKFLELAPPGKDIYVHKTTATDTENMKVVFQAVKDTIVKAYLRRMGLLDYSLPEK